jgi:hypothetical protein
VLKAEAECYSAREIVQRQFDNGFLVSLERGCAVESAECVVLKFVFYKKEGSSPWIIDLIGDGGLSPVDRRVEGGRRKTRAWR